MVASAEAEATPHTVMRFRSSMNRAVFLLALQPAPHRPMCLSSSTHRLARTDQSGLGTATSSVRTEGASVSRASISPIGARARCCFRPRKIRQCGPSRSLVMGSIASACTSLTSWLLAGSSTAHATPVGTSLRSSGADRPGHLRIRIYFQPMGPEGYVNDEVLD